MRAATDDAPAAANEPGSSGVLLNAAQGAVAPSGQPAASNHRPDFADNHALAATPGPALAATASRASAQQQRSLERSPEVAPLFLVQRSCCACIAHPCTEPGPISCLQQGLLLPRACSERNLVSMHAWAAGMPRSQERINGMCCTLDRMAPLRDRRSGRRRRRQTRRRQRLARARRRRPRWTVRKVASRAAPPWTYRCSSSSPNPRRHHGALCGGCHQACTGAAPAFA